MTDRLKDWLTGQQLRPTDQPTGLLTDRLTDWLTDWSSETNWPTDWLTDWKHERPVNQLNQTISLYPQRRGSTIFLET